MEMRTGSPSMHMCFRTGVTVDSTHRFWCTGSKAVTHKTCMRKRHRFTMLPPHALSDIGGL